MKGVEDVLVAFLHRIAGVGVSEGAFEEWLGENALKADRPDGNTCIDHGLDKRNVLLQNIFLTASVAKGCATDVEYNGNAGFL